MQEDIVKITDTDVDVKKIMEEISKKRDNIFSDQVTGDREFVSGINFETDQQSPQIMNRMGAPKSRKSGPVAKVINKVLQKAYYVVYNSVHGALSQQQMFNEYVNNKFSELEYQVKHVNSNSKYEELDFDYLGFENRHRGTMEEIREKQLPYLNYFKKGGVVLDIGCGRGEFMKLLNENGYTTLGLDINKDMISSCVDQGLMVYEDDAINFLKNYHGQLDGIFLGQVIEHLTYPDIIKLVQAAYAKLSPGGVFIAETPNVQVVMAHIGAFYSDPSHITFIHPETIKFICELAGFIKNDILFLNECPESKTYTKITKDENMTEEERKYYQRLNDVIFGYRDFSIIAYK